MEWPYTVDFEEFGKKFPKVPLYCPECHTLQLRASHEYSTIRDEVIWDFELGAYKPVSEEYKQDNYYCKKCGETLRTFDHFLVWVDDRRHSRIWYSQIRHEMNREEKKNKIKKD